MKQKTCLSRKFVRKTGALLTLLCLLLSACTTEEAVAPTLVETKDIKFPTITVEYGDVYTINYATGGIQPCSETLSFTSNGFFADFDVIAGQQVKKGDVLAHLDTEAKQAQLDSLKETLEYLQDAAELELTTLNLTYQQVKEEQAQLQASGAPEYALELKYIEAWEATMDINHAKQNHELQFGELQEQVRQIEEELSQNLQIVAPFDGTVTWVDSELRKGAYLEEGTPVIAISSNDQLYIVSEKMNDSYRSICQRIYAKIGDQEFDLIMRPRSDKEDVANKRQQYFLVSEYDFVDKLPADVDTSSNALVVFLWNYHPHVLNLPNELIHQDESGYYVHKVVDNKLVRTDIEVGFQSALETVILSGLEEGDAVYAG